MPNVRRVDWLEIAAWGWSVLALIGVGYVVYRLAKG